MKPADTIRHAATYNQPQCLEWPHTRTHDGYGIHTYRRPDGTRTSTTAHRAVLTLTAGQPPHPDMEAAHLPVVCHNPACINPHHLYWATPEQNRADRAIDGGNGIPGYINQATVGRVAGVSEATVSRVLAGKYRGDKAVIDRVRATADQLGYRNFRHHGWRALRLEALARLDRS